MTTLMIKTHNITGLKYFCKSTKIGKELESYKGSGKHWLRHIKKHGYDVTTEIFAQYDNDNLLLIEEALKFSKENDIVKSKEWANLKEENGLDGAPKGCNHSEEAKQKMRGKRGKLNLTEEQRKLKGEVTKKIHTGMKRSKETCEKISKANSHPRPWMIGKTHSEERKKKNSESQKGIAKLKLRGVAKSEEHKKKISDSLKGKYKGVPKGPQEKVRCPHCTKEGGVSNMKRWHFDNCKLKG